MQSIEAIDRNGKSETFEVSCEKIVGDGYEVYSYEIRGHKTTGTGCFVFEIARISDDRMMVLNVNNFDIPEYSGKGIVKAMIAAVSKEFTCDVVSSSNKESSVVIDDGRKEHATRYWKKWTGELSNVDYLSDEDRFIYRQR